MKRRNIDAIDAIQNVASKLYGLAAISCVGNPGYKYPEGLEALFSGLAEELEEKIEAIDTAPDKQSER
ncbi:MAG: hypothetical protein LBB40_05890 [Holophagales bacterium]|jgi:hypothetical protein|nr:hypothetical protein [Holophagales bacterium]